MPIDIDQFEARTEDTLRAREPTNAEVILSFLSANADTTSTAIASARSVTERFGPEDPDEWGPGLESEGA